MSEVLQDVVDVDAFLFELPLAKAIGVLARASALKLCGKDGHGNMRQLARGRADELTLVLATPYKVWIPRCKAKDVLAVLTSVPNTGRALKGNPKFRTLLYSASTITTDELVRAFEGAGVEQVFFGNYGDKLPWHVFTDMFPGVDFADCPITLDLGVNKVSDVTPIFRVAKQADSVQDRSELNLAAQRVWPLYPLCWPSLAVFPDGDESWVTPIVDGLVSSRFATNELEEALKQGAAHYTAKPMGSAQVVLWPWQMVRAMRETEGEGAAAEMEEGDDVQEGSLDVDQDFHDDESSTVSSDQSYQPPPLSPDSDAELMGAEAMGLQAGGPMDQDPLDDGVDSAHDTELSAERTSEIRQLFRDLSEDPEMDSIAYTIYSHSKHLLRTAVPSLDRASKGQTTSGITRGHLSTLMGQSVEFAKQAWDIVHRDDDGRQMRSQLTGYRLEVRLRTTNVYQAMELLRDDVFRLSSRSLLRAGPPADAVVGSGVEVVIIEPRALLESIRQVLALAALCGFGKGRRDASLDLQSRSQWSFLCQSLGWVVDLIARNRRDFADTQGRPILRGNAA